MIRLIATDMDDTLLNEHSDVTERTVQAMHSAMDAGVMFSLSSGRMTESMVPFAERLGLNAPMILFNGALIFDFLFFLSLLFTWYFSISSGSTSILAKLLRSNTSLLPLLDKSSIPSELLMSLLP